jgi:hypothetical protein
MARRSFVALMFTFGMMIAAPMLRAGYAATKR